MKIVHIPHFATVAWWRGMSSTLTVTAQADPTDTDATDTHLCTRGECSCSTQQSPEGTQEKSPVYAPTCCDGHSDKAVHVFQIEPVITFSNK